MEQHSQNQIQQLQKELNGQELSQENYAALQQRKKEAEEMKDEMLAQICSPQAYQRLKTVKLVKPEGAKRVEAQLLNLAKSGNIQQKITEQQIKEMLVRIGEAKITSKIKIQRKTYFDEEEEESDNDDDLM